MDWSIRQRVQYSVGFPMTTDIAGQVDALPERAWTPAYDGDGEPRDGAWVAELTGVLKLTGWPTGLRVIVRAERPHPGAQLKFTDSNGNRLTAFATNTIGEQLADLELRHRRRARCEDRIRNAKDTGLNNLPQRLRPESGVDCCCATGHRANRMDADPRLRRHPRPASGTPRSCGTDCSRSPPGSAGKFRNTWLHLSGHAPIGTSSFTAWLGSTALRDRPDPDRRPSPTNDPNEEWNPAPTQATWVQQPTKINKGGRSDCDLPNQERPSIARKIEG